MPAADPRKDAPRVTADPSARDPMPGEPGGPPIPDTAGEYRVTPSGKLKRTDDPTPDADDPPADGKTATKE